VTTSRARQTLGRRQRSGFPAQFWSLDREASLNWLALGLLLAAWNAADDRQSAPTRPEQLRGYSYVSVRAATRTASAPRSADRFGT
jgi:hypothetical protein